jgi:hypothetical protein
MKKLIICLLPALTLFFASAVAGRADQFTQLQNSPNGYWVSSPTPPPPVAYYYPPPGYYAGPPPYPDYYGPGSYYGPRPYYGPPIFFSFGFGFHGHHH